MIKDPLINLKFEPKILYTYYFFYKRSLVPIVFCEKLNLD